MKPVLRLLRTCEMIYAASKIARKNVNLVSRLQNEQEVDFSVGNVEEQVFLNEKLKWQELKDMNDSKLLWKAIDYNGNINVLKSDMRSQDIANVFEEKCKIDFKQTIFKDVTTDKIDMEQDSDIPVENVESAVNNLKSYTKAADGISSTIVKAILPIIMPLLILLLNTIFDGGMNNYPLTWLSLMLALPKKGKLVLPNRVRGITVLN